MPTVPLNTITGPSGARLPNVGFAKPNMAEAQGSVAHALSSAASTAGRSADIMGQAIRSEAQRSDLLMRTEAAKASGRASMFAGIGDLGNTMIKGGAEFQRLSEIRAAREAQSLLSQFRMDMSRTMYGAQDAATGQRIPGTLETPFAPTTEGENEPQGATIATSKAMRAWHENPNGAFQKASPRVKELFRQYAAEPTEDFMRQSFKQDAENYQRWKSQQDQMSESASLNNLNLQAASGDQQVWNMAAQRDAGAWAMSQMESYQADPTNRDPAKAKWRGDPEQSDEMAKYFRTGFLQKANLQRIETLTASAMAEPDKARREQFLEMAAEAAEWKPDGAKDPILPPDVVAKMKLTVRESADKLVQRDIAIEKQNIETAQTLRAKQIAGRKVDPEAVKQAMSLIPQEEQADIEAVSTHAVAVDEMALWDQWRESQTIDAAFENGGAGGDLQKQGNSIIDSFKTEEAKRYAKGSMYTKPIAAHTEAFKAVLASRQIMRMTPEGPQFLPLSDWQLTQIMLNGAGVMYTPSEIEGMRQLIAKDRPDPVVEQQIASKIGQMIGNDRLAEIFDIVNGQVVYQEQKKKAGSKKTPDQITDNTILGGVELKGYEKTGRMLFAPTQRRMEVQARVIRQAFQAAYDYERAPKVMGKGGVPPETRDQYIERLLSPANNLDVREWNNLKAEEEMRRKATVTSSMTQRYYEELQAPFYEK